jgi:hypothetical protein
MPLAVFRLRCGVLREWLARGASDEDAATGASKYSCEVGRSQLLYVAVYENRIVVFFERILARIVQIDSRGNTKSLLDEAMSEAADSAEQVCDGPSVDRVFFNHPPGEESPGGAENRQTPSIVCTPFARGFPDPPAEGSYQLTSPGRVQVGLNVSEMQAAYPVASPQKPFR